MAKAQVFHAVGKRKTAIARVYIKNGSGRTLVNERDVDNFFPEHFRALLLKPWTVTKVDLKKFDVFASVEGGGVSAQAESVMFGTAKALTLFDPDLRPALKKAGLLTRDSRVVERKKYGHKKARKSFQFSKR